MFYEDAQIASKLLSIALTSRDKSSTKPSSALRSALPCRARLYRKAS